MPTARLRAAALIVVLSAAVLWALVPFVSGLFGAAVLYVLFARPYRWLARALRPGVAALVTLLAALLLIVTPLAWLVGNLIAQAPNALRTVQDSPLLARAGELRVGSMDVGTELAKASGTILSWLSAQILSFVGSAASAAVNLTIALFGLYYMLRSATGAWPAVRDYIPFSTHTSEALRDRFFGVTEATVLGTGVVIVVQGVIIGIGFAIVGLPDALFWGTVAVFAAILPVVGSALVWLPAVAVLVAQQRYGAAVTLLVLGGGIAGNADNLIRPHVYRRVSNIHPMITLVGAFAGIRYVGLVGLLLGPLAIAYVFELLHFYREEYGAA